MIAESVKKQSVQIFKNIEYLFDDISDELLHKTIGGFPLWKQLYHLLHSMDKNFIDPQHFSEPEFHIKNLDIIYLDSEKVLNRNILLKYSQEVESRLKNYLESLDDKALEETLQFREMTLTRLELILAQFRHIFFHIGYLHCCIKMEKGRTPEFMGLYPAVPEK